MRVNVINRHTRVVGQINTLISELTAHFVDSIQSSNNKHLEIQFWGDTQKHVHVEIIVMCDERLGSGTTSNSIQHRSLHRHKVTVVKPAADVRIDLGSGDEDLSRVLVHHEIEISLSETLFRVLESIMLVGDL